MALELTDLRGYVVLTMEPNISRGHLVAGALEGAGIPAHVEEDDLADEFAMSLKLRGAPRVRVLVPQSRLEEARAVFLAMSQPIPFVDEDEELDAYDRIRRRNRRLIIAGFIAFWVLPFVGWVLNEIFGWI